MKVKRDLAFPMAVGSDVPLQGRVRECANLIQPGTRLLDVGCSSGWLAPLVMSIGFEDYVGIDRVIVGPVVQSRAKFVAGSALDLPFMDYSFDALTIFDVIEHLPRGTEQVALREAHRVLQTNGKLYFSTPHASPLHTPLDPVWWLGHRHYRRETVRALLCSAGFIVDRMFVAGGLAEGLDHIRLLVYKHALRRQQPAIKFVSRLIERSHGRNRQLGMTVFAVASRVDSIPASLADG